MTEEEGMRTISLGDTRVEFLQSKEISELLIKHHNELSKRVEKQGVEKAKQEYKTLNRLEQVMSIINEVKGDTEYGYRVMREALAKLNESAENRESRATTEFKEFTSLLRLIVTSHGEDGKEFGKAIEGHQTYLKMLSVKEGEIDAASIEYLKGIHAGIEALRKSDHLDKNHNAGVAKISPEASALSKHATEQTKTLHEFLTDNKKINKAVWKTLVRSNRKKNIKGESDSDYDYTPSIPQGPSVGTPTGDNVKGVIEAGKEIVRKEGASEGASKGRANIPYGPSTGKAEVPSVGGGGGGGNPYRDAQGRLCSEADAVSKNGMPYGDKASGATPTDSGKANAPRSKPRGVRTPPPSIEGSVDVSLISTLLSSIDANVSQIAGLIKTLREYSPATHSSDFGGVYPSPASIEDYTMPNFHDGNTTTILPSERKSTISAHTANVMGDARGAQSKLRDVRSSMASHGDLENLVNIKGRQDAIRSRMVFDDDDYDSPMIRGGAQKLDALRAGLPEMGPAFPPGMIKSVPPDPLDVNLEGIFDSLRGAQGRRHAVANNMMSGGGEDGPARNAQGILDVVRSGVAAKNEAEVGEDTRGGARNLQIVRQGMEARKQSTVFDQTDDGEDSSEFEKDDGGGGMLAGILGGVGIIADIIMKLAKSSPMLSAVLDLFQLAFTLFFMPFGNMLGEWLLPLAIAMIDFSVWFNQAFDEFRDWAAGIPDWVKEIPGMIWNNFKSWFEFTRAVFNSIGGRLMSIPTAIIDGFKNAIQWIWNKINGIFGGGVVNSITSAPGKAYDGLKGLLGFAGGGYISPSPGGTLVRVGEGTRGEYIVPEGHTIPGMGGAGGGTTINITFSGNVYGMNDFENKVTTIVNKVSNKSRYR